MEKYDSRKDVPEKYKWDLTDFYKDENDFEKSFQEATKLSKEIKNYRDCLKDATSLKAFLDFHFNLEAKLENLYVYSYLVNDQELGISKNMDRKNRVENLCNQVAVETAFFTPTLLKLEPTTFNNLISDSALKEYVPFLKDVYKEKGHVLEEDKETIVSNLVNSMNYFDDMSSTLLNSLNNYGTIKDKEGKKVEIATNNYRHLLKTEDEKNRKIIYKKFNKVIDQYATMNAMYLNGYVSMNETLSKIYNYKNSWEQKLESTELSNDVFKSLVSATESNLKPLQDYFRLKKNTLGLETLHLYDLSLDMGKSNKEYSIEDAWDLCRKALKPLGEDYLKHFEKIIDRHYIDYCQYKNKCSGGYSFSTSTNDSRILLSFNGSLDSVSTIIHEGGHNVHHQYMKENNPLPYREASSFVAEVASLTNECLLSSYLAENGKTKEERLAGIENILGVITSNLYGAVREGKMEQEMYETVRKGSTLTKDYLDKLTKKSLKKYYGDTVKLDKYAKNSWVTRSHYYMHFYLYSYAICISVASYVAKNILEGNQTVKNQYKEFLKTGCDKKISEIFAILGVDLTNKKVYEEAISYFNSLVLKYETISKEA